ncbi:hypothetical protein Lal_00039356 [Lupinus albus]|nr:hypothetical protein Lal_00039356 [Lupinus albus]
MTNVSLPLIHTIIFYLSEHPSIVGFRWNHIQSWGSTWSFLFTSITTYLLLSLFLHLSLSLLLRRNQRIPLCPIPALHSLFMSLISATIFAGILLSATAEIRDTRWFWRRSKTPLQWLFCFPLGTKPSGRIVVFSTFQSFNLHSHVLPLARILTIISSSCDPLHNSGLLSSLRVQILDRYWVSWCVFSVCVELSDCVAELQCVNTVHDCVVEVHVQIQILKLRTDIICTAEYTSTIGLG